jgi:hypothetical protein
MQADVLAPGGTSSARFDTQVELFAAKLESGEVRVAALVVNIDNAVTVDLCGGRADEPPHQKECGETRWIRSMPGLHSKD